MQNPELVSLVCVAAGALGVAGAVNEWTWFMNHRKTKVVAFLLGYQGARYFYGLMGGLLMLAGTVVALDTLLPPV